ncbi:MAG: hypothetical protein JO100_15845 [Pseudonocardia sp.]|nr:hypothetical protein [Pseudonocardia sp.]
MRDKADAGRHILFLTLPTHAHLRPTLGVARELIRRGHRVTYASYGPISETARAIGAEVVTYETSLGADFKLRSYTEDELGAYLLRGLTERIAATLGIERQMQDDRPDLIAYDFMVWPPGRALGRKWELPTVRLLPIFASNDAYSLEQAIIDLGDEPVLTDQAVAAEFHGLVTRFNAEYGLDASAAAGTGERSMVFLPRSFQPCGETFGDDHVFVGPCFEAEPADEGWRAAEGDLRPMVFVSLGTVVDQPEFFWICAEAFDGQPWRVVLAVLDALDEQQMVSFPDNFTVRRWVPYGAVLPYAAVFVSQAGMGGIMEAARSATPLVVIPYHHHPELRINANRITELGMGQQILPVDLTAERLRQAVLDVAGDPRAAEAMVKLRADIQAAGGVARAADVIEECLGMITYRSEQIGVVSSAHSGT